jgi:hypothetical protein
LICHYGGVVAYASSEGLFFENYKEASIARAGDMLTLHPCCDGLFEIVWYLV